MSPTRRCLACLLVASLLLTGVLSVSASLADELRPGTTTLISRDQAGQTADGGNPSISSDGRYVAFESWDRLTPEDTDTNSDIYRWDRLAGDTILVSVDAPGLSSASCNFQPSISADGQSVAYRAGGLFGGAGLVYIDRHCYTGYVVLRNLAAGSSRLISGSGGANAIEMSGNGRWLAILYGDGDSDHRAAIIDLSLGARVWQSDVLCNACVVPIPEAVAISSTGRFVAYEAIPFGNSQIYLLDRDADDNGVFDEPGKTTILNVGVEPSVWARFPSISDDGRLVAFVGIHWLIGGPLVETYVRNLTTNSTETISQTSFGVPGSGLDSRAGWQMGLAPSISGDGRFVAFSSQDTLVPGDVNPMIDVFVRDRMEHKTYLVSVQPDGKQNVGVDAAYPSISADGKFAAFSGEVGGIQRLNNFNRSAYIRDLWTPCSISCLPNPSFVPPPAPTPPPPPPPPGSPVPGCIASGTTRTCTYTASSSTTTWKGAANWWCVTVYQGQTSSMRTERCYSYIDRVYSGSIASSIGDKVKVSVYDVSGAALGAVHAQDG